MAPEMTEPRPRKDLGQHFLTRPEVCAPLVAFLEPRGHTVVEIGPGSGALTGELLAAGAKVVAWEVDLRWVFALRRSTGGTDLGLVAGDALQVPLERLPPGSLVAGNLPYSIATRLVLDCLESALRHPGSIERAAFLVQLEVAERLTASPGDSAYGSLSVLTRALAHTEVLGRLAPGAFRPPPRVDSAFVGLRPRRDLVVPARYDAFARLVRAAFALRRKTLRNSLAASFGTARADAWLEETGLGTKVRAESLGVGELLSLTERMERDLGGRERRVGRPEE